MAPIENIGSTPPQQPDRLRQRDRVETSRPDSSNAGAGASRTGQTGAVQQDSVSISPQARQLAEQQSEVSQFQNLLQNLEPADNNRVNEIRARIDAGEFDSPEVLAGVSDAISQLPQFQEGESTNAPQESGETSLSAFTERIRSGLYQSDAVLEQVASGILSDIGSA